MPRIEKTIENKPKVVSPIMAPPTALGSAANLSRYVADVSATAITQILSSEKALSEAVGNRKLGPGAVSVVFVWG